MAYKYKKLKFKDGTTMDEHRYLMEQSLGRKLKTNEVVHHKDDDSRNNSLDNLVVMSRSEHTSMHAKEYDHSNCMPPNLKGEEAFGSKLTDALVRELRIIFKDSRKGIRKKSRELGISHTTLIRVLNGTAWAHVV